MVRTWRLGVAVVAEPGQLYRKVRECLEGGQQLRLGGSWGRGLAGGAGAAPKEEAKWRDLDRARRRPLSSFL